MHKARHNRAGNVGYLRFKQGQSSGGEPATANQWPATLSSRLRPITPRPIMPNAGWSDEELVFIMSKGVLGKVFEQ